MNPVIALTVVVAWTVIALYCHLCSRRQRKHQEEWDEFTRTYAKIDQELDGSCNF